MLEYSFLTDQRFNMGVKVAEVLSAPEIYNRAYRLAVSRYSSSSFNPQDVKKDALKFVQARVSGSIDPEEAAECTVALVLARDFDDWLPLLKTIANVADSLNEAYDPDLPSRLRLEARALYNMADCLGCSIIE